ncbi:MAG: methionine synthase [Chthonomonadales bacterium]|nr:methionine synthase [Chthonomonadales bacterium]
MDASDELRAALRERILVLEGPKGTMIQAEGLEERDYKGSRFASHPIPLRNNNEILNLVRPDIIASIHTRFAEAGADIVATNTFNGNRISQADFGTENLVAEINEEAARIARASAERVGREQSRRVFVAGTMGPTPRTASLSPDVARPGYRNVTFDELAAAYQVQAEALIRGGVDLLILETTFDTLNAKAGIYALMSMQHAGVHIPPLVLSVTFSDRSGRTLSGQTLEAFWVSVSHAPLLAIGINCGLGAAEVRGHIAELSGLAPIATACYPNAGLPNAFGGYDQSPEEMASLLGEYAANGWLNIVGGCCGSTDKHIKAIADAVRGAAPRSAPPSDALSRYAGLEALTIRPDSNFIMIGERTNVSGSRKFARLIRSGQYEEAVAVARDQVEGGANIIDINMDEALLDAPAAMREFVNTLASEPAVARVPIMVDSSNWDVVLSGLKTAQGKCIVNSVSLKDGEDAFRQRAIQARMFGAALVVMAFDEAGQADTVERKVAICRRAYRILTEQVGVPPQDLVFDPNVLAIGTGIDEHADYGRAFIEAVRQIKLACPGAKCSGGISNLSFAFRGNDRVREAMHAVFLYHAIHAGLDMGIVNAGQLAVYEDIEPELREAVEDLILNRRPDATERLLALAEKTLKPSERPSADAQPPDLSLEERIASSLIHGSTDTIDSEMDEALAAYGNALAIIEGPLMGAMKTIGDRFADGRMFLPQVVKSARTMKRAVARLTPHMSVAPAGTVSSDRAKIVLATVKGDVHDIGKNIVGVVLACNGHEIIDLGVMVPADTILSEAAERGATIVGLSGLITPSLDEMVHVAREMERRGMTVPLLIGGATTSRMHTAVKIAPEYSGPVIHVQDASRAGGVVQQLIEPGGRAAYEQSVREEQAQLREQFANRRSTRTLLSLAEARARRPQLEFSAATVAVPAFLGSKVTAGLTVEQIRPYIDWTPFFHVWDVRGRFPDILTMPDVGERASELYRDAQEILEELAQDARVRLRAVHGFFPARACGDDIILERVTSEHEGDRAAVTFHMLRQQADKGSGTVNYCLADFVAPEEANLTDYVGLFAVTAGEEIHTLARESRENGDDYRAIMIEAIADRLAEALAEYLHEQARRDCGFGHHENLTPNDLIKERYRGIRPAPGYPACPDHSEKPILMELLGGEHATGIRLTETMAMAPPSSVCGFYINHPSATYFPVGTIGRDQLEDYAARRGMPVEEAARWLSTVLE